MLKSTQFNYKPLIFLVSTHGAGPVRLTKLYCLAYMYAYIFRFSDYRADFVRRC